MEQYELLSYLVTKVTASADTHLILWDVHNGRVIKKFKGHEGSVKSLNIHSNNPGNEYIINQV